MPHPVLKCILRYVLPLTLIIIFLTIQLININEPMALIETIPRPPLGDDFKFTTFAWNLPKNYGKVLNLTPIGQTPPIVPQFRPMSGPPRNYSFNQVI